MTTTTSAKRPAAPKDATPPASVSNKPLFTHRDRDISVAIFANPVKTKEGRSVTFRKASVQHSYTDADGVRQRSRVSLPEKEWLAVAAALQESYTRLHQVDDDAT